MKRHSDADSIIETHNGLKANRTRAEQKRREAAQRYAEKLRRETRERIQATTRRNRERVIEATKPKTKASSNDWPPAVRRAIRKRSQGFCEIHGDPCRASMQHHRKLRRHRDHTVQNGLDVCPRAHHQAHHSGQAGYDNGWLVHANDDPASIPVLLANDQLTYLTPDGHYQEAA